MRSASRASSWRSQLAQSSAVSVKETSIEASRPKMMGHTSSTNINCVMPPQNRSGTSARTSINVEAMTARRTSAMPSIVAVFGSFPMRRCRSTAWMSMMVSSTSRPDAEQKPDERAGVEGHVERQHHQHASDREVGRVMSAIKRTAPFTEK